jgi:hypothetical protein
MDSSRAVQRSVLISLVVFIVKWLRLIKMEMCNRTASETGALT